ncbi:hypothetical protein OS493_037022 [Desmophyllum pertusum]|uniref:Uncharacterized protein n=1 Tax=Desmophyllum pertusum TaxID=174260 RepID=A0A9W9YHY0_9CNID|nr:hypothetical protein OS493_037022 [Desmophyllum pertusum]
MLAFCKKEKSVDDSCKESTVTKLSDREKAGLQYVGGYVMHNLHKKHSIKKTSESQEAMAILKAGKLEATVEKQKLISALNRGGVRAFSLAKDLIQRYKMKAKQTKAKSLRKEISRSCQIEEPRHD